ncbi:hypothetical protein A0126_18965 (plasmid) [Exiguobacterium sp. N4-1P]|uniref:hypothetical protein n=1 Tax=Exiguobacterium sp. N4-1P TaxID=2051906 RepID=UPI000B58CC8B|nr:hypothetical protein [Exiguobacterium sp. N4-1P]ASI36895.1 hypothetical protein A0126_15285 [Exiguobacterium sp. N4-1P]ASI37668.1 hypothetical protein A0126_18965 [Exiguobacterium sp. N4-1P]
MHKQLMHYTLFKNNIKVASGNLEAHGSSVYEMTEDVVQKIKEKHLLLELEFIDVSNFWTFEGESNNENIRLEFAPQGIYADKFGLEE